MNWFYDRRAVPEERDEERRRSAIPATGGLAITKRSAIQRGGTSRGGQRSPERGRNEQTATAVVRHDRPGTVEPRRDRELGFSEQRLRPEQTRRDEGTDTKETVGVAKVGAA